MALSEEHKVMVEVYRQLPDRTHSIEAVSIGKMRTSLLFQADKSDPLNQLVVAGVTINERFCLKVLKVKMNRSPGSRAEEDAITALIAAVIENYAEIRDALAESP